jgi:hypothetical protein
MTTSHSSLCICGLSFLNQRWYGYDCVLSYRLVVEHSEMKPMMNLEKKSTKSGFIEKHPSQK